jgi:hypothetical protein
MLRAQKQPDLKKFLTKTKTRVGLVVNPNHETKKQEQDHDRCGKKSNKILLQK